MCQYLGLVISRKVGTTVEIEVDLSYVFIKRDLKGFKCMTASSDVLETFLRVIETFRNFQIS